MIRIGLSSEDRTLQSLLSALGNEFDANLVPTDAEINQLLQSGRFDLVLLDLDAYQDKLKDAVTVTRQLVAAEMPLVVMASDSLRSNAVELVRLGAYNYCRRPPSIRDLKTTLQRAHESWALKREIQLVQERQEAAGTNHQMIGSSPQMQRVYDLMHRVANISATVLVTGESGTGKELIANGIHRLGIRANRPFVAVCCGAIPESLIEAELFGHEKGAFTGTVGTRVGYLEQAGEGTLLLDEIGELSLSTQVKLLRVIQQREFCRLGSNKLIPLKARLIFATHQNLREMVTQGSFREDFYYRINVVGIDAPPLRDHAEDIPHIALHFLRNYSEMYGKPMVDIDPAAVSALQGYSWPGNVRELENVIQQAIIVSPGDTLTLEDLPVRIQEENVVVNIEDYEPSGSFERQLRSYKIKLAITALRENHGNKTLAARSLNISRAYLHRLIRVAEPDGISDADLAVDGGHPDVESA
jgi:DNA-binding NtrC family response regulator